MATTDNITSLVAPADYRMATHLLYPAGDQPAFLIPVCRKYRTASLRFFMSGRQRMFMRIRWLLSYSRTGYSPKPAMSRITDIGGVQNAEFAISLGTPGPYNKPSILILDSMAVPRSLVKIATTNAAKNLISNEAAWLASLNEHEDLRLHIPSLIRSCHIESSLALVQSIATGRFSRKTMTHEHVEFVNRLQRAYPCTDQFLGSEMHLAMLRRYTALRPLLSANWNARIAEALDRLEAAFSNVPLPMVAAHRDFAPWNIRDMHGRLFVFDWEYASLGYAPLYDLFHFLLIPRVVRRPLTPNDIRDALRTALFHAAHFDAGDKKTSAPAAQLLSYFLDVCLFYLESNNGNDSRDSVVQRYGILIDNFTSWDIP